MADFDAGEYLKKWAMQGVDKGIKTIYERYFSKSGDFQDAGSFVRDFIVQHADVGGALTKVAAEVRKLDRSDPEFNTKLTEALQRLKTIPDELKVKLQEEAVKELQSIPAEQREEFARNEGLRSFLEYGVGADAIGNQVRRSFGITGRRPAGGQNFPDADTYTLDANWFEHKDLEKWASTIPPDLMTKFEQLPNLFTRFLAFLYKRTTLDEIEQPFMRHLEDFHVEVEKMSYQQKALGLLRLIFSPWQSFKRWFKSKSRWKETTGNLVLIVDGLELLFFVEIAAAIKQEMARIHPCSLPAVRNRIQDLIKSEGGGTFQRVKLNTFTQLTEIMLNSRANTLMRSIADHGRKRELHITPALIERVQSLRINTLLEIIDEVVPEYLVPSEMAANQYYEFLSGQVTTLAELGQKLSQHQQAFIAHIMGRPIVKSRGWFRSKRRNYYGGPALIASEDTDFSVLHNVLKRRLGPAAVQVLGMRQGEISEREFADPKNFAQLKQIIFRKFTWAGEEVEDL